MLTAYRQDLQLELFLRRNELNELIKEKEENIESFIYDPFKKSNRELDENIEQCNYEIQILNEELNNPQY